MNNCEQIDVHTGVNEQIIIVSKKWETMPGNMTNIKNNLFLSFRNKQNTWNRRKYTYLI